MSHEDYLRMHESLPLVSNHSTPVEQLTGRARREFWENYVRHFFVMSFKAVSLMPNVCLGQTHWENLMISSCVNYAQQTWVERPALRHELGAVILLDTDQNPRAETHRLGRHFANCMVQLLDKTQPAMWVRRDYVPEFMIFWKLDFAHSETESELFIRLLLHHGWSNYDSPAALYMICAARVAIALRGANLSVLTMMAIVDACEPTLLPMHTKWRILRLIKHYRS